MSLKARQNTGNFLVNPLQIGGKGVEGFRNLLKATPAQYQQLQPQGRSGDILQQLLGGNTSFYGNLGSPTSPLQRQSTDALQHFLNQPAPEQRALDISMPALQNILNGRPGQGVIDALQPSFDRNLASANQQGGRFGSSNAILRSRAVEDFNLLGANAAQQGQQTQLQAAQMLAMLSGQAGQNPFSRMLQGAQEGRADAQQMDLETQRRIQLLSQALGGSLSQPWMQTKAASPGLGSFLAQLAGTAIGSFAGPLGASAGSALGKRIGEGIFGGTPSNTLTPGGGGYGQPPADCRELLKLIQPILKQG